MRPIPLPAGVLEARHARSIILRPPEGVSDDDCGTVEALYEYLPQLPMPHVLRVAIAVDPGDVDRLLAGEPLWLSVYGQSGPGLSPFMVDFLPEPADSDERPLA